MEMAVMPAECDNSNAIFYDAEATMEWENAGGNGNVEYWPALSWPSMPRVIVKIEAKVYEGLGS